MAFRIYYSNLIFFLMALCIFKQITISLAYFGENRIRNGRKAGLDFGGKVGWTNNNWNGPSGRSYSNNERQFENQAINEQQGLSLSENEKQTLIRLYGPEVLKDHYKEIEAALKIIKNPPKGQKNPLKIYDPEPASFQNKAMLEDARFSAVNPQEPDDNDVESPAPGSNTITDNLERAYFNNGGNEISRDVPNIHENVGAGLCNIHGLWLSTVAGVAIELIPILQEGHIEIRTKIFDQLNLSQNGILSGEWTGSGMISQESPTTITIVFQEHFSRESNNAKEKTLRKQRNVSKLPKTAVFVGQCLVCAKSPVLQGTWIVFPNTQSCTNGGEKVSKDLTKETLHLVKH